MASPAFKNGKPLFKNGKPAFTGSPCTCCGTCTCASVSAHDCAVCAAGCTPNTIEAVLSGITTNCCSGALGSSADANGATLAGTFSATQDSINRCAWFYVSSATFNMRKWSGASCTGAATGGQPWQISVSVGVSTIVVELQANIPGNGALTRFFSGQVSYAGCSGTYVLTNGTGPNAIPCGSGGTITITFCP